MEEYERVLLEAFESLRAGYDEIGKKADVEKFLAQYAGLSWGKRDGGLSITLPLTLAQSLGSKVVTFKAGRFNAGDWKGDIFDFHDVLEGRGREFALYDLGFKPHLWKDEDEQVSTQEKARGKKGKKGKSSKPRAKVESVPSLVLADGSLIESLYDPESNEGRFAIRRPDGQIKMAESIPYRGKILMPLCDAVVRQGVVLLPSAVGKLRDEEELIGYIQGYIHAHVDVSETFKKIASYYVLLTWLYDNFTAIPYLRALGQHGTGKTRFLKTVGNICYRPVFLGGAVSAASLYRMLELYQGTLLIDETDYSPKSEVWALLLQILNLGYEADAVVIRCDGNNFKPIPYHCYGPKIIAGRKPFQDKALDSRCLTETFYPTRRDDIPLQIPRAIEWKDAREIRNMLLSWRFARYNADPEHLGYLTGDLEPRLEQIVRPLQAILTSDEAKGDIEEFVKCYAQKAKAEMGQTLPGLILRAIAKLLQQGQEPYYHLIVDKVQPQLEDEDYKLTGRKIGTIVRKALHLESCKGTQNRTKVKIDEDAITRIRRLGQRYGLEESELTLELPSVNLELKLTQNELTC